MDLIQSEQPAVKVEPEPRYVAQTVGLDSPKTEHGHAWLRTIIGVILAVILIVGIVFLARWIYHKTHQNNQTAKPATSQSADDFASRNNPTASQLQGSGSTKSSGTSTSTNSSTTNGGTVTPNDGNANSQITNTGPGNVAALFVGSSLVAGGLHYSLSSRRSNSRN